MKLRNFIKKIFLIGIIGGYLFFFLITLLRGQIVGQITIEPPTRHRSFGELINAVIDFLFTLSLLIVPLVIIIAGYFFVFSEGKAENIEKAKKLFIYALVGFVIILLAKGFVEFILQQISNQQQTQP